MRLRQVSISILVIFTFFLRLRGFDFRLCLLGFWFGVWLVMSAMLCINVVICLLVLRSMNLRCGFINIKAKSGV